VSATASEAAIDDLLRGDRLSSGKLQVGPLGANAIRLLRAVWGLRQDLSRRKGVDQAVAVRAAYLETASAAPHPVAAPLTPRTDAAVKETASDDSDAARTPPKRRWRLHRLRCQSIRGVAPIATVFEFAFDGVPILLYGPKLD
jgi:hypothetical protein